MRYFSFWILSAVVFFSKAGYPISLERDAYGLVAGANLSSSTLVSDPTGGSPTYNSITGAMVNFFWDTPIGTSLVFSSGLSFVQKGSESGGVSSTVNYLEIPALVKAYLTSDSFRPYLAGGLAYGLGLGASRSSSNTNQTDATDLFAKNELSAQLGLGFEVDWGSNLALVMGTVYSYGLTNTLGAGALAAAPGTDSRFRGIYVFLGFRSQAKLNTADGESRAAEYLEWRRKNRPSSYSEQLPELSPLSFPTTVEQQPGSSTNLPPP